jgi:hypothetical protein
VADADLDPLFTAGMDSAEEAIPNSLFMAQTTTGFGGHVRHAVPLEAVRRSAGQPQQARRKPRARPAEGQESPRSLRFE